MKFVCIGDSLTFGYGVSKKNSWIELTRSELNLDLINKGVNGDTTAGMLSRSYKDVIENSPDYVIIMGGCNDFMCDRSLDLVTSNLSELAEESLKHNIVPIIGIEPLLSALIARERWSRNLNYENINSTQSSYRNWIITFCNENNINYIDFQKCFELSLKNKFPEELYIDGVHPTPFGHKLMAKCVKDVFEAMNICNL